MTRSSPEGAQHDSVPLPVRCRGFNWWWLVLFGCGTDAVGVSECRDLEAVRCRAAAACGFPDVQSCQRFYRDHCLHGFALEAVNTAEVEACAADLELAGQCAGREGESASPAACAPPLRHDGSSAAVCDLIRQPERLDACAFLRPSSAPPPQPAPSATDGGT